MKGLKGREYTILRSIRILVASVVTGATLLTGVATASAQQQDGMVNVAIGDVTIARNVAIGVAAQVAANVCGVSVGLVAVPAAQVDRTGNTATVCQTNQGVIESR